MTEPVDPGRPGISRRKMLARSAAAGGVIWAAPTVLASPAGASHGGSPICGAITAVAGQLEQVSPPPSAVTGAYEHTDIRSWTEQDAITLGSNVAVDATPSGGAGTVPAGTTVSVHFFHFDPPGNTAAQLATGTATFSGSILGIVHSDANLDASDHLGAAGTTYPTGTTLRGLELSPTQDGFTLTSTSLTLDLHAIDVVDQVRVLVACEE